MATVKSIDAIQSRISEIEAELAADTRQQELTVLRETEKKLLAINGTGTAQKSVGGGLTRTLPRKGKQPRGRVAQHEAARLAVEAVGHPLETSELVIAMPQYGAEIGGPNAERNLTSIISKRGDLISVRWRGRRTWWPKGKEVPK